VLIWIILAVLTAVVLFVLLRPLAAPGAQDRGREAFDAAVYRDQLNEIESDRARGLIDEDEAEAARIEIARRLLAADSNLQASDRPEPERTTAKAAMVIVGVGLPLLALGLYLIYGSPRLPDQPLTARLEDPGNDRNLQVLVARVEARLREHPEEGEGWDVIAPVYLSWQRYDDAAEAYAQALRLLGPSAKRLSGQGQALVLANNGLVTEAARVALERALELDGTLIEPRILLAIAKEQDGQFAAAIDDWRALLADAKADAPWRAMVEKRIEVATAHLAGKPMAAEAPDAAPAGGQNAGGPSAAEIAAAQSMTPEQQKAMVERMVQNLAARLDQNGGDLADWLKLLRAYGVLDRKEDALKALARAKTQFSGDSQALQELDELASELGLKS
jgi:cytochrome c-type biogenesis protein CcmH